MGEFMQLIGGVVLLIALWSAPCYSRDLSLKLFISVYVVFVYLNSHYGRSKLK